MSAFENRSGMRRDGSGYGTALRRVCVCRRSGPKVEVVYWDPPRAEVVVCFFPLQKPKQLVCRVQLVSARGDSGDSPPTQSGAFEILSQHPSVGVLERLRAREKARLTGGPGEAVISTRSAWRASTLRVLESRPVLQSAR